MNTETKKALELYDEGTPVAIQDPILRMYLQGHRWGYHPNQEGKGYCPVCDREENK
jgi:hypothetical protein